MISTLSQFRPQSFYKKTADQDNRKPNTEPVTVVGGEKFRAFPNREGYDESFLGVEMPLPQMDSALEKMAAKRLDKPNSSELEYTHFSVVQHKERRTPILTAANVDGAQYQEIERDGDWVFDSRIPREVQMGNDAYSNNAIDRGHMVRRRDPMWGDKAAEGADDTFVYTNASLQHADLNQKIWLDLENSILKDAVDFPRKVSVFTGPVLREDDPVFDNNGKMDEPTRIPQAFWKVVVYNEDKQLKAEAFVMSQEDLINKKQGRYGDHQPITDFSPYRVSIDKLEEMTHLEFGPVTDAIDKVA